MSAVRAIEPDVMAEAANHARQVVAALAAEHTLSPVRDQGIRLLAERAMSRLLDRIDGLLRMTAELEGLERRADAHARTCPVCDTWLRRRGKACVTLAKISHAIAEAQRDVDCLARRLEQGRW